KLGQLRGLEADDSEVQPTLGAHAYFAGYQYGRQKQNSEQIERRSIKPEPTRVNLRYGDHDGHSQRKAGCLTQEHVHILAAGTVKDDEGESAQASEAGQQGQVDMELLQ